MRIPRHADWLLLAVVLTFVLSLQLSTLRWASNPIYDEGVHAEAGRAIFEGYLPYRDFSYPHPPLLPLFIGAGLWFFKSMYGVRLLYLMINILSVFPFYAVLKRLGGSSLAALIGIGFYLTYFVMVHHDFRIVATRPFSNLFFIGFLYWSVVRPHRRWSAVLQTLCALGSVFSFFGSAANLFLISLALIVRPAQTQNRWSLLWQYTQIGAVTCIAIAIFLLFPGAWQQTVLEHLRISSTERWGRILWILDASREDVFFYVFSLWSLLIASIALRRLRWIALAMLAMVLVVLVPGEFFPHYVVSAAVALAFGAVVYVLIIERTIVRHPLAVALSLLPLMLHMTLTLPSLVHAWTSHSNPLYEPVTAFLATLPEPMLTFMEPIYAVESSRRTVPHYYRAAMRFGSLAGHHLSDQEFEELGQRACTIVLPPWDQSFVPSAVQEEWAMRYTTVDFRPWLKIFLTHRSGCTQS